jgi:hypothetical protein
MSTRLHRFLGIIAASASVIALAPAGLATDGLTSSAAAAFTLTPEVQHALERRWASYNGPKANPGVRDLFNLVLNCAAYNGRSELAEQALALAAQMRETDPQSKLFGNYRWSFKDPKPDDPNAVEFSMQYASLTWALYRERLSEKARDALESEIRYSIAGIRHHRVPVSYTNIFLMKAANCIFIGENLPDETLAREGYAQLAQWIEYTRQNGIHEYSSPTYYGVDLGSLGALVSYAKDGAVRKSAAQALALFWTEIGAHWFPPFAGMAGVHSRDYDFLGGHGILDLFLAKAGWIHPEKAPATDAFIDLTSWTPPQALKERVDVVPRTVVQRWGENPWERATQYVGSAVSLGTAGAAYGPQDKILTVNLPLGPSAPIVNFAMDERDDPYGQAKVLTGGGHMKLTHIVPFVATAQHGTDAILIAQATPAKRASPFARSLVSHFIFPDNVTLWLDDTPVEFAPNELSRDATLGSTLFIRTGEVAVALRYVFASSLQAGAAKIRVIRDGQTQHAMRFSAIHSETIADRPAVVAVWVRVTEGLNDGAFAIFRRECSSLPVTANLAGDILHVSAPSGQTNLRVDVDLKVSKRLRIEGADADYTDGILLVNGRDLGRDLLR